MNARAITILRRAFGALALAGLLAACGESEATLEDTDYRARFPIGVTSEVVQTVFYGDGGATMTGPETTVLSEFVAAYKERGQRPLTITMGGAGESSRDFAIEVQKAAIAHGLAKSEVLVGIDPTLPSDGITLSFVSYTAVVPECGYWYRESNTNNANVNSPNFGCASQHNLGLMLADPSDLLGKTEMIPRDGQRTAVVVDLFRAGQITGAEFNESDTSIVDIGE